MSKPIDHLRANTIAYLALFVALGGTSYAAINIPPGSVGTRQLRNGAVTAKKLDRRSIAGSVVFWAQIARGGEVIASSEPVRTSQWATGIGRIVFRGQVSRGCFALANGSGPPPFGLGDVVPQTGASIAGQVHLALSMLPAGSTQFGPLEVTVAVICPT